MPAFVDTAKILVKSGKGGNGAVSFHREKYVAAGGPDGGDGGRGGDVILRVDDHMSTLMDFRYKRKYVAGNGMDGTGKRCSGRDGEDMVIKVPLGRSSATCPRGSPLCWRGAAMADGAISTSPPLPGRSPTLPRPVFPAKSGRWSWS